MSWNDLEAIIDNAGKLQEGWDSYSAKVPSAEAQKIAKGILEIAAVVDGKPDRVAPDVNGGFHIKWKNAGYTASVYVSNNGSTCLARSCEAKNVLMVDYAQSLSWAVNMALDWVNSMREKMNQAKALLE